MSSSQRNYLGSSITDDIRLHTLEPIWNGAWCQINREVNQHTWLNLRNTLRYNIYFQLREVK